MKFNKMFVLSGVAAAVVLAVATLSAQDVPPPPPPGGHPPEGDRHKRFDPEEIQKRIMEGVKERLEFKDETEWAAVQPLVQKVMDARRDAMAVSMSGLRLFSSRRSSSGGSSRSSSSSSSFFGAPSPEVEALQKAIDDNVPAAQLKAALEKLRAVQKEKEAKVTAAQDELRKVLTVRQEALAALIGLLP